MANRARLGSTFRLILALLAAAPAALATPPELADARAAAAQGDYSRARTLAERALSALSSPSARSSPDYGEVAFALGTYLERSGETKLAEQRYREALDSWTKSLGPDHPNVSGVLASLASLLEAQGRPGEALPMRERVVEILKKALGPTHAFTGTALHNLGRARYLNNDLRGAEKTFLQAFEIRNAAQGSNHPDVAQTLAGLATVYRELGDLEQARRRAEAAILIYQNAGTNDPEGAANALETLGAVEMERGNYARAAEYFKNAIGAYAAAFGKDSQQVGMAANNLAQVFAEQGDYREAERGYQAAISVLSAKLGADHPDVALVRSNLAELLLDKGDFPSAEAVVRPAIEIYEKRFGKRDASLVKPLGVLARVLKMKQEFPAAEVLLLRVEEIERATAPNTPRHAATLAALGAFYRDRDQAERSSDYFRRALAIYEKAYGPQHPSVASMVTSLASADALAGHWPEARKGYERALAMDERAYGAEHPTIGQDLLNLAGAAAALGDAAQAAKLLERASTLRDKYLSTMMLEGSEHDRRAVYASLYTETQYAFSMHLDWAPKDQKFAELAYQTLLRRKGRLVEELGRDVALARASDDPKTRSLLGELGTARTQLSRLVLSPHKPEDEVTLRARILGLERDLSEASASYRASSQPVTTAQVAAALPEGTALVEYVKYYPFNLKAHKTSEAWGKPEYAAYVLTHDGALSWLKLGASAPIDAAVDELRKKIRDRGSDPRAEARRVDELVFQPLRTLLPRERELFVSTDGALSVLPFAALIDEKGHYAVERFLFTFVASGRDLLRMQAPSPKGGEALVVGNPSYDDEQAPTEPALGGQRGMSLAEDVFMPLPGTQLEAETVAKELGGAKLVTGKAATTSLLGTLHGPRVLHIATHGFFVAKKANPAPAGEGALLGGVLPNVDDPFVRSGLAFSGANNRKRQDDGLLSAYEAASLDLSGTRLVVLSACETGLGEIVDGLEVQGLGRAFSIAGAESVLMSLWKVDDSATRELMTGYYSRLAKGGGRAESLRDVQRDFLADSKRAHPYFWAAFELNGDPRALSGERVRADVDTTGGSVPSVEPGNRGCGCEVPAASASGPPSLLALLFGALVTLRRRRPDYQR